MESSTVQRYGRLPTSNRSAKANVSIALDKMGQPVHYPLELKPILQKKGFPVVYERKFAAPINRWPPGKQLDRLGTMMTTNFLSIIDTISLSLFTTSLGWSPKEVESLLRDVRQEIGDTVRNFSTPPPFIPDT